MPQKHPTINQFKAIAEANYLCLALVNTCLNDPENPIPKDSLKLAQFIAHSTMNSALESLEKKLKKNQTVEWFESMKAKFEVKSET